MLNREYHQVMLQWVGYTTYQRKRKNRKLKNKLANISFMMRYNKQKEEKKEHESNNESKFAPQQNPEISQDKEEIQSSLEDEEEEDLSEDQNLEIRNLSPVRSPERKAKRELLLGEDANSLSDIVGGEENIEIKKLDEISLSRENELFFDLEENNEQDPNLPSERVKMSLIEDEAEHIYP